MSTNNLYAQNKRIISLAPNITNILYYLDYQKNIIAVDKFSQKPKNAIIIGDLMSINYENLISLKPDIIFLTKEQEKIKKTIKKIKNIDIHIVNIKKLDDLNSEINKISNILKIKYKEIPIAPIISISKILNEQKSALIIIDRDKEKLNNIFVVGSDNFMNDFLSILNLKNIMKNKNYPKINIENIINLNPDIIIDLTYGANIDIWNKYTQLKAVKNKKIYKADISLTIPSPYIINDIIKLKNKLWN
jgi:iron complex transport system substrate-binding protein